MIPSVMVTMHAHNSVSQSGLMHELAEHHLKTFRYNHGLTAAHEAVWLHVRKAWKPLPENSGTRHKCSPAESSPSSSSWKSLTWIRLSISTRMISLYAFKMSPSKSSHICPCYCLAKLSLLKKAQTNQPTAFLPVTAPQYPINIVGTRKRSGCFYITIPPLPCIYTHGKIGLHPQVWS